MLVSTRGKLWMAHFRRVPISIMEGWFRMRSKNSFAAMVLAVLALVPSRALATVTLELRPANQFVVAGQQTASWLLDDVFGDIERMYGPG